MNEEQNNQKQPVTATGYKRINYWIVAVIFLSVIIIVLGFFTFSLLKNQKTETLTTAPITIPVSSGITVSPVQKVIPSLTLQPSSTTPFPTADPKSGNQFIQMIQELVPVLENNEFERLTQILPQQEVTCDASAPYLPRLCESKPNGTKVTGFFIGYEGSEGTLYSKEQFINTLKNYVQEHGRFTFGSSRIYGESGSIMLYNNDRKWEMGVVLKRTDQKWSIQYTLLGVNLSTDN